MSTAYSYTSDILEISEHCANWYLHLAI